MRSLICLCCILLTTNIFGQVSNDSIAGRIQLTINSPHASSTVDCTVEWSCLNQKLTQSCIKYHNDQWFSLVVPDDRQYFLNLSGQECQDIWGVQVLVIDGEACNPSTYALLNCHSDGNTDDIFVRLNGLVPGREYLVNVDGYLHDLCTFVIEWSDTPRGLPASIDPEAEGTLDAEGRIVNLKWTLTPDMAGRMQYFEIYRSDGNGQPFSRTATLPHQRNAYGEGKQEYVYADTLDQLVAEYKVVGQSPDDRQLLLFESVRIDPQVFHRAPENNLFVPLEYNEGEALGIMIYNAESDSLLYREDLVYRTSFNAERVYYIGNFKRNGIRTFKVVVIRKDGWIRREFEFEK